MATTSRTPLPFSRLFSPDPQTQLIVTDFYNKLAQLQAQIQSIETGTAVTAGPAAGPAGTVRYASRIITSAQQIAIPASGVVIDIAHVTLPPGQWDLNGEAWVIATSGSPNIARIAASISPTSATAPTEPADGLAVNAQEPQQPSSSGGAIGHVLPLATLRANIKVRTDYFLSVSVTWSKGGAFAAYGKIAGRLFSS
jgi:hypothetical protein